jgi:hypothetical protein
MITNLTDALPSSVYTAGPIDLCDTHLNWRDILRNALEDIGANVVLFDPLTAFKISDRTSLHGKTSAFIEAVNNGAIDNATAFVCLFPRGISTVGTPIEIDRWHHAHGTSNMYLLTNISYGSSAYLSNRVSRANWIDIDLDSRESTLSTLVRFAHERLAKPNFTPPSIGQVLAPTTYYPALTHAPSSETYGDGEVVVGEVVED